MKRKTRIVLVGLWLVGFVGLPVAGYWLGGGAAIPFVPVAYVLLSFFGLAAYHAWVDFVKPWIDEGA